MSDTATFPGYNMGRPRLSGGRGRLDERHRDDFLRIRRRRGPPTSVVLAPVVSNTERRAAELARREARPEVREERIRPSAGLNGQPALALSAWRGRSGRRYCTAVHGVDEDVFASDRDRFAVLLAVKRDRATGVATLIDVIRADRNRADARRWRALVIRAGATELQRHRLADSPAQAAAIVADLALETSPT